jgi:hypothetical protein
MTENDAFPAVGHKYVVDFTADSGAGGFRVQLDFHSLTSLTYTRVRPHGSLSAQSETVQITVEPLRDMLFLVSWKERGGTTVMLSPYPRLRARRTVVRETLGALTCSRQRPAGEG